MIYVLCLVLFMVGLFGALTQKNLIKIIVSVAIIEYAVCLFLILVGRFFFPGYQFYHRFYDYFTSPGYSDHFISVKIND